MRANHSNSKQTQLIIPGTKNKPCAQLVIDTTVAKAVDSYLTKAKLKIDELTDGQLTTYIKLIHAQGLHKKYFDGSIH